MRYHSAGRRVNLSYISCLDVSNIYFNNGVMKKLQSWSWMSMKSTLFVHLYREKTFLVEKTSERQTPGMHGFCSVLQDHRTRVNNSGETVNVLELDRSTAGSPT